MPLQNYVDGQGPAVDATWLNAVDQLLVTVFQNSTTVPAAQVALGISALVQSIVNQAYVQSFISNAYVEGIIDAAYIQSFITQGLISGLLYPQTAAEATAGVVPTNTIFPPGRPERYVASSFSYANTLGTTGTDFTAAINAAMSMPTQACTPGPFQYLFGATPGQNLITLPGSNLRGDARWTSALIASANATGVLLQDSATFGSAAKLVLSNFCIYGNNATGPANVTGGIYLGYNGGATSPYGTESIIDNVTVRDIQANGFNIKGNVGEIGFIQDLNTSGSIIIGTAMNVKTLEVVGASGFSAGGGTVCVQLGDVSVDFLEMEAPGTGTTPFYLSGNAKINDGILSFQGGTIHPNEVLIGAGCNAGRISVQHYFAQGNPWAQGTTYPVGTLVSYLGSLYVSLQAGNLGNQPASSPTFWQLSPTITNGMFNDASLASPNWGPSSTGGIHYADGVYDLYKGGDAGRQITGGLTIGQTGIQVFYKIAGTITATGGTGATVTFSPALPAGSAVRVTSFIPHGNIGTWFVSSIGATGFVATWANGFSGTIDWAVEA